MNQKYLLAIYLFCLCVFGCSPIDDSSPLPEDFFVKFYGDRDAEEGLDILQTDNGYLIMGSTNSRNLTSPTHAQTNGNKKGFYLVFTDLGGNLISSRVFADSIDVNPGTVAAERISVDIQPSRIKPTTDGGYILIGTIARRATGNNVINNDIIIYKLDANGDFDPTIWPLALDVQSTSTITQETGADIIEDPNGGGFVIVGTTTAVDENKEGFVDNIEDPTDIYLHRINSNGTRDWELVFGFNGEDEGKSILASSSGGYAVLGETAVEKDGSGSGANIIFATTNSDGGQEQFRAFGSGDANDRNDYPSRFRQTSDGGFIIVGTSSEIEQDITTDEVDESNRIILMKVTANRTLTYFRELTIRDIDDESGNRTEDPIAGNGNDIIELSTGGFLVVGKRIGGEIDSDDSGEDIFLVKTNSFGEIVVNEDDLTHVLLDGLWERNYGGLGNDEANSVIELSDGKLIVVGTNDFGGTNSTMMMLMKLNRNGELLK